MKVSFYFPFLFYCFKIFLNFFRPLNIICRPYCRKTSLLTKLKFYNFKMTFKTSLATKPCNSDHTENEIGCLWHEIKSRILNISSSNEEVRDRSQHLSIRQLQFTLRFPSNGHQMPRERESIPRRGGASTGQKMLKATTRVDENRRNGRF